MINPRKNFCIYDFLEVFLRRRWYFAVPFLTILLATTAYIVFAPRTYIASTLILVTPQKIPEDFVRSTVTSRIEDRLQTIAQESLSRTRLEQIISELGLYRSEARWLKLEEIVELMRKNTRLEIKGREGYFTISYKGEDPRTVTTVTNRLAAMFIEENLKFREQQAQGTSDFLSIELEAARVQLDEQEQAIAAFKRRHMGELPEQREANLAVLQQTQLLYQRIGESLRAAQDRKLLIRKQLSELEMPSDSGSPGMQAEDLRRQVVQLASRYTEQHPDVIAAKKKLEDMEKGGAASREGNPLFRDLQNQAAAVELEIRRLNDEENKVKSQLNMYRQRIENTPIREQAMASMAREHVNTKESYEKLLKKDQEARQARNLEHHQKGEQFKIVDPARIPEKPHEPDIPKVFSLGILLAFLTGGAAVYVRDSFDRTFHDAEDAEVTLGLKILANVPRLEQGA
ncbi:MAG TPA: hypothetical protein PK587_00895 [Syntrophales bacterium]|nr:hypothetical protein [Syntrophales bacterium]